MRQSRMTFQIADINHLHRRHLHIDLSHRHHQQLLIHQQLMQQLE
jgi:hypothetical protein